MTTLPVRPVRGITSLLGTTDHKRIGLMIGATAFAFFLAGGVIALFMRTELATPGLTFMSRNDYNQFFTIHGSTMIYLFMTPLALAVGVYFVPLQVGAAEMSGARFSLAAFWAYLSGGLMMYAGFLTDHDAGRDGWFSYTPLSTEQYTPGVGMDLWTLGVALAVGASVVWGACILATIARRRAPGMTMLRLSPFTWTEVVSCLMVVFSFPVLVVAMLLLYLDRSGVTIYGGGTDGALAWQHLFWFYGHPVVYVMFFPFVGMVAETVATFSRRRFFGYKPMVASLLLFSALSMSVWSHHMFATGHVANKYFSLTSTALVLPAGIEYFDIIGTMIGGSILLRTPMLFAIGFLLEFLVGGMSGIFVGSPPLDYNVTDTYFVVAHLHYVLFAGSFFGFFAGLYYWWPKITGTMLRDGLGKVHFVLMFIGTNLTFFPMHILGLDGMRRRIADYPASAGWTGLNILETVGAYIIGVSILVFMWNAFTALRSRVAAPDDPWGGHSLEWATTSPPPRHNFTWLPPIRSHSPMFDFHRGEAPDERPPEFEQAASR